MRMNKILAGILSLTLATTIFAGCGSKDESSKTSDSSGSSTAASESDSVEKITFPLAEPVEMTMFAIINEIELPDVESFKELETQTNVHWNVQSCMGADLTEKRNLLLASDDYPDVFYKAGLGQADLDKYGAQGIFIPLNDLIEQYAPNLTKLLNERTGVKEQISSPDGSIYSLPEIDNPSPAITVSFINQKWLKTLGLEEPTNLDDLYNVLKAFKEKDPNGNGTADEIAFTANTMDSPYCMLPYFGLNVNLGNMTAITDNSNLEYIPTMDKYKDFLAYLEKLYSEGLMDKNSFTQTKDQQIATGAQGDVLGLFFDAGAFLTVGRDRDEDYKELTPFEKGVYPVSTGANTGTFAITDSCKNPETAMAWIDQFYSEDGGILAWMGVEGKSYEVKDDGTWSWIMGDYKSISDVRQHWTVQGAALHPSVQPELWFTGMTDPDEKYLTEERDRLVDIGADPFPSLKYSDEETKTLASVKADIDPYLIQYMAKVVTGETDLDSSWEEYKTTLNNMGQSQIMDIYTKAYAEATK